LRPCRLNGGEQLAWRKSEQASVLIIVLWIAFGLVSITLYFASSMSSELRASDNRACGLAAEQAIEGAARYVTYILASQATNGAIPDPSTYANQAVPVGNAHFWMIGRDTNATTSPQLSFALVDEASKMNLNSVSSNMLVNLPNMTADFLSAILDWRDTNSNNGSQASYSMLNPPYQCKGAPFETVDELRLVRGADMDVLLGEDFNRNGVLDPNEDDENHDGTLTPGMLEYFTVYSREPVTNSDGTARVNISVLTAASSTDLRSVLETNISSSRADQILAQLGLTSGPTRPGGPGGGGNTGPPRGGPPGAVAAAVPFASLLQFYRKSGMTVDELGSVANLLTVTNGTYILGRVNVNTASAAVLACLPGMTPDLAQTLVNYRQTNPDKLTSVGWVADALGSGNAAALDDLESEDCLTTQSYQFTADIAAIGPFGRGYRRTRFVFDVSDGTPRIVYRQDLTHLGWALGREIRQTWFLANNTR
jgi:type II secretory pathway component PulK